MPYVLSTKNARRDDSEFVIAAARAFYCDWYLSDERRAARIEGPGVELTDAIPETQRWAFNLARNWTVDAVCKYTDAPTVQIALDRLDSVLDQWRALIKPENAVHIDREPTDENMGWYAAMQAMGHGVSLDCVLGTRVEVPRCEAYPR